MYSMIWARMVINVLTALQMWSIVLMLIFVIMSTSDIVLRIITMLGIRMVTMFFIIGILIAVIMLIMVITMDFIIVWMIIIESVMMTIIFCVGFMEKLFRSYFIVNFCFTSPIFWWINWTLEELSPAPFQGLLFSKFVR